MRRLLVPPTRPRPADLRALGIVVSRCGRVELRGFGAFSTRGRDVSVIFGDGAAAEPTAVSDPDDDWYTSAAVLLGGDALKLQQRIARAADVRPHRTSSAAMVIALGRNCTIMMEHVSELAQMVDDPKATDIDKINSVVPSVAAALGASPGTQANDNWVPTLAIEYYATSNISVETICCFTQHTVTGTGSIAGANIANHVTLIHRRDSLRAEKIGQDRLFKTENIKVIWDSVVEEFLKQQKKG